MLTKTDPPGAPTASERGQGRAAADSPAKLAKRTFDAAQSQIPWNVAVGAASERSRSMDAKRW